MKKALKMNSYRYVRRSHLCEIADNYDNWNFNRQLDSNAVRRLPKKHHLAFPVIQYFVHEHRHMEPCEPHMRLVIDIQGDVAIADVPLDYFEKLPKAYIVSKGGNGLLLVLLDESGEPWSVYSDPGMTDVDQAVEYFIKHCDDPKIKKFVQASMNAA